MTKERDTISTTNDDLLHELQAYRSVNVAQDVKPRTTLTRVGRQPLISQSLNTKSGSTQSVRLGTGGKRTLLATTEVEYKEGDMTLDELT